MESQQRVYYHQLSNTDIEPDVESMSAYLLNEGVLFCNNGAGCDGEPSLILYVLCNDHFAPAADGESVTYSELPTLYECYKAKGWAGVHEFVANKRGISPLYWRDPNSDYTKKTKINI